MRYGIKGVAARYNSGTIIQLPEPFNHHHIFWAVAQLSEKKQLQFEQPVMPEDQGFYTEDKEFISREEALAIAISNGYQPTEYNNSGHIFSEDLW